MNQHTSNFTMRRSHTGPAPAAAVPLWRCAPFLAMLIASSSAFSQTAADPRQLLAAAAASITWTSRYASVTDVRYRALVGEEGRQQSVGTDSVVRKYQDGDRLHIVVDLIDHLTSTGDIVARACRRETVFNRNGRACWWFPLDNPRIGTLQLAKSPDKIKATRTIADCDSATASFLDGNVDGMGNIITIMLAANGALGVRRDKWQGMSCDLVTSTTAAGSVAVWIAPDMGNVIVGYRLQQTDPIAGPSTAEFIASDFHHLDGTTIVRAGRSTRTWIDVGTQQKWQENVQADRVKLDLHPDFKEPALFSTAAVPNGIRVYFDELPDAGVEFIWNNGAPIARIDADLFAPLDQSIQRTAAGETVKTLAVTTPTPGAAGSDEGFIRITQSRIVLGAIASAAAIALAGIYLRSRKLNVPRP